MEKELKNFTPIYKLTNENPFMFGFYSDKYDLIYKKLSFLCEFGKTYVEKEVNIPLNPFNKKEEYKELIKRIKRISGLL